MHIFLQQKKKTFIIILQVSLQCIVPAISRQRVQYQTLADSSSSSISVPRYGLPVGELGEVSITYECGDHRNPIPSRITRPSAAVSDGTCSSFTDFSDFKEEPLHVVGEDGMSFLGVRVHETMIHHIYRCNMVLKMDLAFMADVWG